MHRSSPRRESGRADHEGFSKETLKMKCLLPLLWIVSFGIGCEAQREPSAEHAGEPWASLRELHNQWGQTRLK